jgi:hypothetical protein
MKKENDLSALPEVCAPSVFIPDKVEDDTNKAWLPLSERVSKIMHYVEAESQGLIHKTVCGDIMAIQTLLDRRSDMLDTLRACVKPRPPVLEHLAGAVAQFEETSNTETGEDMFLLLRKMAHRMLENLKVFLSFRYNPSQIPTYRSIFRSVTQPFANTYRSFFYRSFFRSVAQPFANTYRSFFRSVTQPFANTYRSFFRSVTQPFTNTSVRPRKASLP